MREYFKNVMRVVEDSIGSIDEAVYAVLMD